VPSPDTQTDDESSAADDEEERRAEVSSSHKKTSFRTQPLLFELSRFCSNSTAFLKTDSGVSIIQNITLFHINNSCIISLLL
jgi:hypothetical protein